MIANYSNSAIAINNMIVIISNNVIVNINNVIVGVNIIIDSNISCNITGVINIIDSIIITGCNINSTNIYSDSRNYSGVNISTSIVGSCNRCTHYELVAATHLNYEPFGRSMHCVAVLIAA